MLYGKVDKTVHQKLPKINGELKTERKFINAFASYLKNILVLHILIVYCTFALIATRWRIVEAVEH